MPKRIISYFLILTLILGLLISLPYQNIVSATSTPFTQDFEEQVPNNDFSISLDPNHFMVSHQNTATFKISSAQKRSGLLSFRCSSSAVGYWNLSYSTSAFLKYFKTYFYCGGNTAHTKNIYFYNYTLGRNKALIRYYAYYTSGSYRFGHYEAGSYVEDNTGAVDYTNNFAYSFSWNITQDNGLTIYTCPTGTKTAYANNSTAVSLGYRIDRVYMTASVTDIYFDDWNYTIATTYTGTGETESYCGDDVTAYDMQFGDIYQVYTSYPIQTDGVLIGDYNVPLNTTIRAIGLLVNVQQYINDPTLSNYQLTINGVSIGSPLCFSPYGSDFYLLYWTTATVLSNEVLSYVFEYTGSGWGNPSNPILWQVGGYSGDLDGDGDSVFYFNSSSTTWYWDWVYVAPFWFPVYRPHTTVNNQWGVDLAVTFWCDAPIPPAPDVTYENSIGLHNWKYKNETGYIYTYPDVLTTGIIVTYTLADAIDDYYIAINWSNSTGDQTMPLYLGDFPTDVLQYPDGTLSCVPVVEGRYDFCMYNIVGGGMSFGLCDNQTAWVVGNLSDITDYYLYTDPPITNQFDLYDINYKYDNPNSYTGAIAFFSDYEDYTDRGFYGADFFYEVEDGSEGSYSYRSTGTGEAEYWVLYANKNGNYVQVFPMVTHLIRMQGIIENKIWTNVRNIPYSVNGSNIVIYYQHRFLGSDIAVYDNGNYVKYVGNDQSDDFSYIDGGKTLGLHTLTLEVTQNGSLLTVASCQFTVSAGGGNGGGGGGGVLPAIAQPLGSIVGLIITIFCLLTPFIIGASIHLRTSIHPVVYTFTGGLGMAISTILGFFPVWIPLFVVACGIIVLVIFYINGSSTSSE